ncbi:MAG: polyribonucleotide nucleotidyltransferase [Anaerolineae bacterium]
METISSPMGTVHRFTAQYGDRTITLETGKLAEQAGGAVTVTDGETVVFATATMSKSARAGIDFFPLSVDFEEKMYAAGRIPGSFFRREGRPSEQAILSSRVVDRTLRPLFPDDMRNEVQVILTAFCHDQEHQPDMLGIIAASAALMISNIPWNGPVAGTRIGMLNGELVVNPTVSQMPKSALDLRLAGTADAINMVECGAAEVDEETMLRALKLAHDTLQPVIAVIKEMAAAIGKTKSQYVAAAAKANVSAAVEARSGERIRQIIAEQTERSGRNEALDALKLELVGYLTEQNEGLTDPDEQIEVGDASDAFGEIVAKEVRRRIVDEGVRPDGRGLTDIRPLAAEVGVIPRVHGSGLFKRGQTQVLTIATLGTPGDAQEIDTLSPEKDKRYMHHYNFPPYSTGETSPLRGPKRREIGHGALAETALRYVIPPESEFPYTIRLVSEVLSSNGSTSMASVCGSTLSLMDAGVPIIRPVGGIAMGLIQENGKTAVLTDIQGLEDHIGDMDFKVAGTTKGITALQMDIKITGVSGEIMEKALAQAREARLKILDVIAGALPAPRTNLSTSAPRILTLKVNVSKIGAIIGPGGKTVRSIQERTGAKIDIEEDGTVYVSSVDAGAEAAAEEIRGLTEDAEIGKIYTGKVTRIESFGAFVEFLPGKEGMVHISQLADYRVESVESEVSLGDEIMVMVTNIDDGGKVRLSRQAVLEGWTPEEARARDSRGSGGGNRGGGDRRGGGGYRGGGDRGGDRGGNRGGGGYRGGDRG